MSRNAFWIAALLACAVGVLGAIGTGARTADARIPGDVCQITAWDSNGTVIPDGGTVGGDGSVFLVFRVEDDPFGYVNDFILDGPVQEVLEELEDEIADLEEAIENEENSGDPDEDLIEELEAELAALLEVQAEYIEAIEGVLDTDLVEIDSSTGSARITSQAEVVGFEWVVPNIGHILVQPGTLSQRVDHMFPSPFNDADGNSLDSIRDWLVDVGVPNPGAPSDFSANVCGGSSADGWGFVDIKCIEAGRFRVNVIPQRETTENRRGTIDMYCPGQADSAEISVSPSSVEAYPVANNVSSSIITVAVMDQSGARIDGAEVTFTTNRCKFSNPGAGAAGDLGMTPAGGGTSVTAWSDSDSTLDANFVANNPLENAAGTAEVSLDCAGAEPGVATVVAVVQRPGADIVLEAKVTVVGQTAATGLTLTLTPDDIECGETILAVATAVDALGQPVSDGTAIYFTTDTSSGVVGGEEGAQGFAASEKGKASVSIATDPGNPGIHTVIAYTMNAYGAVKAQTSETYVCDGAVAPVAPTVAPPTTGTGSITPPNTGSAGLASSTAASSLWLVAAGALVAVLFSGLGLVVVRSK